MRIASELSTQAILVTAGIKSLFDRQKASARSEAGHGLHLAVERCLNATEAPAKPCQIPQEPTLLGPAAETLCLKAQQALIAWLMRLLQARWEACHTSTACCEETGGVLACPARSWHQELLENF